MPLQTHYSDDFKAQALVALQANGGSLTVTARALNIPITTLSSWRRGVGVGKGLAAKMRSERQRLSERLEDIVHLVLDYLPRKLDKANASQLAQVLAITVDKLQLITDRPTAIQGKQMGLEDERLAKVYSVLEAAQARLAAQRAQLSAASEPSPVAMSLGNISVSLESTEAAPSAATSPPA